MYEDDKYIAGSGGFLSGPDNYFLRQDNGHPYSFVPSSVAPAYVDKSIYPGEENAGWMEFQVPAIDATYNVLYVATRTSSGACACYEVANLHVIPAP